MQNNNNGPQRAGERACRNRWPGSNLECESYYVRDYHPLQKSVNLTQSCEMKSGSLTNMMHEGCPHREDVQTPFISE